MKSKLLTSVYAPTSFQKKGHELIDQLTRHLDDSINDTSDKAIRWNSPEDEYQFWQEFLVNGNQDELFPEILSHTTHVHNPKYIGHQVCPPAPFGALAGLMSSFMNNGMAVYEMGMAPSAIERIITEVICTEIGYDKQSRGFLTSGGTLANLTALLTARKTKVDEDIWKEGHGKKLGVMVFEEAHYCIDRAARIMGLGEKGIIKIPGNQMHHMNTELLEKLYKKAQSEGIKVFAIVGSAPSTASGMYDDLTEIARFSNKYNLWFHVDGAHGGAAVFSKKYKHLLKGIEHADSVVIDGHKMMMMPTITTALLYKNGAHSHTTFSQKADYLLQQSEDEDWYNLAKRTFECTKTMMSIQWYILLKTYGKKVFDEFVTTLYDLGETFAKLIKNNPLFELAVDPMSNIVCFRYIDPNLNSAEAEHDQHNADIRQWLLEDGEFYIVQTKIKGVHYLRTTIMNPFTTKAHLQALLDKISSFPKNNN